MRLIFSGCVGSNDERSVFGRDRHVIRDFTMEPATTHTEPKHTRKGMYSHIQIHENVLNPIIHKLAPIYRTLKNTLHTIFDILNNI